jgi:hypothetical protein
MTLIAIHSARDLKAACYVKKDYCVRVSGHRRGDSCVRHGQVGRKKRGDSAATEGSQPPPRCAWECALPHPDTSQRHPTQAHRARKKALRSRGLLSALQLTPLIPRQVRYLAAPRPDRLALSALTRFGSSAAGAGVPVGVPVSRRVASWRSASDTMDGVTSALQGVLQLEAYGGRISAENHADGGASFRVRLPAESPAAGPIGRTSELPG